MAIVTTGRKADITADIFGTTLTLTFSNGQALEIDAAKLAPEIFMQAALHGLKQKLVDGAAIARNRDTGLSATIADKFEAVREIYDRITGPEPTWNKVRATGEGTGNSLLVRALIRMSKGAKTKADIEAFLEGKTKAEKDALKRNAAVAAVILELQAEAAKDSGIDSDELLGGLLG